jgi:UDP-N-acetyl-D-mannosaminuronic acid dehydrogenase
MSSLQPLARKVKNNQFTLGVIGIGRVGLPLALVFARAGVKVIGFDHDKDYVAALRKGSVPFREEGMEELIGHPNFEPAIINGSPAKLKACDIFIFCVGTPLTNNYRIDYSQLFGALSSVTKVPLKGKFIILRSTVPPCTLMERVIPLIEDETGLKAGVDFGAASCPERVLEGHAIEEIINLPEIIGGINAECTEIAVDLFKKINPKKIFTRTTSVSAELAKLYANMYRYVNFALANEFALLAEQFRQDASEIIKAVNDGYPRGGIPRPGLVGGPCLTKDGYFLLSNTAFPDFISLASRLNEFIPQHVVNRLRSKLMEKGRFMHAVKVGLLGLAFKGGSDDERDSPSLKIQELLRSENVIVTSHDPHIKTTASLKRAVEEADAIIIATNHPEFDGIEKKIFELRKKNADCIVLDCWGIMDAQALQKYGFDYIKLGSRKK